MYTRLLLKFNKIFENEDNLKSYYSYYTALLNWVIENRFIIGEKLFTCNRLDVITSFSIDETTIEDIKGNGILLSNEKKRIGCINFKKIDNLVAVIADTLWDLITYSADDSCSNCLYGELRFVTVNEGKLAVECVECGHIQNLDGSPVMNQAKSYFPACKKDIETWKLKKKL